MRNPFTYGGPVEKQGFCNRKTEIRDLKRAVENAERVFLYSERRMGKTSLVSYVLESLPRSRYVAAYVDLWRTDSEASFVTATAEALTRAAGTSTRDVIKVAERFFKGLSATVVIKDENPEVTFSLNPAGATEQDLEAVLKTPAEIAEKLGTRVVVAFDEFQRIAEYGSDRVERVLRSVVQWQADVCYLFLGSRKHVLREMVSDRARPFYKSGREYPLEPITAEAWIPFIGKRFKDAGKEIPQGLVEAIVERTGGHPFYVQKLSHATWELAEPGKRVTPELIEEAVSLVLERSKYAFTERWESLNVLQRRFLEGLANEPSRPQVYSGAFLQRYGMRAASNVTRAVDHLIKGDIIDRENGSFVICDRFFATWIRQNCIR